MNKLESKLRDLNKMLIEDGYNGSNIVIQTLEEIREEAAVNHTHCCEELKVKEDDDKTIHYYPNGEIIGSL